MSYPEPKKQSLINRVRNSQTDIHRLYLDLNVEVTLIYERSGGPEDAFLVQWNVCNIHNSRLLACPCVQEEGFHGLLTLMVQDKTEHTLIRVLIHTYIHKYIHTHTNTHTHVTHDICYVLGEHMYRFHNGKLSACGSTSLVWFYSPKHVSQKDTAMAGHVD